MNKDFHWALNPIKLSMAIDRAQKKVASDRISNPEKEFADPGEEEFKAEYIRLAGLLANEETVELLEDRAKKNDFVGRFAPKAIENIKKRVKKNK